LAQAEDLAKTEAEAEAEAEAEEDAEVEEYAEGYSQQPPQYAVNEWDTASSNRRRESQLTCTESIL
jgi:regulator of protease activity HflC (stomatin/prohibitin superfamily)